jgi:hypothetical protein
MARVAKPPGMGCCPEELLRARDPRLGMDLIDRLLLSEPPAVGRDPVVGA